MTEDEMEWRTVWDGEWWVVMKSGKGKGSQYQFEKTQIGGYFTVRDAWKAMRELRQAIIESRKK